MSRTKSGQPLHWSKTLASYYDRPEWEMFDLKHDPEELYNVANKNSYQVMKRKVGKFWVTFAQPFFRKPSVSLATALGTRIKSTSLFDVVESFLLLVSFRYRMYFRAWRGGCTIGRTRRLTHGSAPRTASTRTRETSSPAQAVFLYSISILLQ